MAGKDKKAKGKEVDVIVDIPKIDMTVSGLQWPVSALEASARGLGLKTDKKNGQCTVKNSNGAVLCIAEPGPSDTFVLRNYTDKNRSEVTNKNSIKGDLGVVAELVSRMCAGTQAHVKVQSKSKFDKIGTFRDWIYTKLLNFGVKANLTANKIAANHNNPKLMVITADNAVDAKEKFDLAVKNGYIPEFDSQTNKNILFSTTEQKKGASFVIGPKDTIDAYKAAQAVKWLQTGLPLDIQDKKQEAALLAMIAEFKPTPKITMQVNNNFTADNNLETMALYKRLVQAGLEPVFNQTYLKDNLIKSSEKSIDIDTSNVNLAKKQFVQLLKDGFKPNFTGSKKNIDKLVKAINQEFKNDPLSVYALDGASAIATFSHIANLGIVVPVKFDDKITAEMHKEQLKNIKQHELENRQNKKVDLPFEVTGQVTIQNITVAQLQESLKLGIIPTLTKDDFARLAKDIVAHPDRLEQRNTGKKILTLRLGMELKDKAQGTAYGQAIQTVHKITDLLRLDIDKLDGKAWFKSNVSIMDDVSIKGIYSDFLADQEKAKEQAKTDALAKAESAIGTKHKPAPVPPPTMPPPSPPPLGARAASLFDNISSTTVGTQAPPKPPMITQKQSGKIQQLKEEVKAREQKLAESKKKLEQDKADLDQKQAELKAKQEKGGPDEALAQKLKDAKAEIDKKYVPKAPPAPIASEAQAPSVPMAPSAPEAPPMAPSAPVAPEAPKVSPVSMSKAPTTITLPPKPQEHGRDDLLDSIKKGQKLKKVEKVENAPKSDLLKVSGGLQNMAQVPTTPTLTTTGATMISGLQTPEAQEKLKEFTKAKADKQEPKGNDEWEEDPKQKTPKKDV